MAFLGKGAFALFAYEDKMVAQQEEPQKTQGLEFLRQTEPRNSEAVPSFHHCLLPRVEDLFLTQVLPEPRERHLQRGCCYFQVEQGGPVVVGVAEATKE